MFNINIKIKQNEVRKIFINVLHRFGAVTFFISGFLINIIQAILYILLTPFSKNLYRRINRFLSASIYAQICFIPEWLSNLDITIYADPEDLEKFGKEHSFSIINHTYEVDWLINWILCAKFKCLGNFKGCPKKEGLWLPILGLNMYFSNFVFLERSFKKDLAVIHKQMTELVNHPDPIWLVFYPEGTRLTPEKHKVSLEYSQSKNLPIYKHHLLPRAKGYVASLPLMKDNVKGLYDVVLAFKGGKQNLPTYPQIIYGEKFSAHVYIRRIPFHELPQDPDKSTQFLYKMFEQKDYLLDSFYKTDDFFSESGIEKLPPTKIIRGYTSLLNFVFWNLCLGVPLTFYWISLLYLEKYIMFTIVLGLVILTNICMTRVMDYSSINSASPYGLQRDTA